jgi:hypothetical protein
MEAVVSNNIEILDCKLRDLPLDEIFINALHSGKEAAE